MYVLGRQRFRVKDAFRQSSITRLIAAVVVLLLSCGPGYCLDIVSDIASNDRVLAIAIQQAKDRIFTGGADGHLRVWRSRDGAPLADFPIDDDAAITALAINPSRPNEITVAVADPSYSRARTIVFDLILGKEVSSRGGAPSYMVYSPDGLYLATKQFSFIQIWKDGIPDPYLEIHGDDNPGLQFAHDDVLAIPIDQKIRLLNLQSNKVESEFLTGPTDCFAIVAHGKYLAHVLQGHITIFDTASRAKVREFSLNVDMNIVAADVVDDQIFFSPNHRLLFGDVKAPLFRLYGDNLSKMQGVGGPDSVISAMGSASGMLVVGQTNGRVRRWKFEGESVVTLQELGAWLPEVTAIAVSGGDRLIALGDKWGGTDIMDTAFGTHRTFDPYHSRPKAPAPYFGTKGTSGVSQQFTVGGRKESPSVLDVKFFPGGTRLAVSYSDGTFKVLDVATMTVQSEGHLSGELPWQAVPMGQDQLLVEGKESVYVWNLKSNTVERSIHSEVGILKRIIFDIPSKTLTMLGFDGVQYQPLQSGTSTKNRLSISCLAQLGPILIYPQDSDTLASLDLGAPDVRQSSNWSNGYVPASGCDSSGHRAAFVDDSGRGAVAEIKEGKLFVLSQFDLKYAATTLAWSRRGKTLLIGGRNRTVSFVDAASGNILGQLTIYSDNDWVAKSSDGFFDAPPISWERLRFAHPESPLQGIDQSIGFEVAFAPGLLSKMIGTAEGPKFISSSQGKLFVAYPKAPVVRIIEPTSTYKVSAGLPASGTWTIGQSGASTIQSIEPGEAMGLVEATTQLPDVRTTAKLEVQDMGGGVKRCLLSRDRQAVATFESPLLQSGHAVLSSDIELFPGENELSFYCFDNSGLRSEISRVIVVANGDKSPSGTAYVISVGVGSFQSENASLPYAESDAEFFSNAVSASLKTTHRYARIVPVIMRGEKANEVDVLSVLKALSGEGPAMQSPEVKKAKAADAVFLYFSGHGIFSNGQYRLLMHDYNVSAASSGFVTDTELNDAFSRIEARDLLLVIDACQSGAALGSSYNRLGPFSGRGFSQMAYDKGLFVLAATQGEGLAYELNSLEHGFLTDALIAEGLIKRRADNDPADGVITMREFLNFAVQHISQIFPTSLEQTINQSLDERPIPRAYIPPYGYNATFAIDGEIKQ